ncbi:large conductance mechanosensitive channel [Peptoniphilus asaccharolyticus DSM 20463]|uniref:Large-conductance mechanosensitive channel n=1 Tax=Peptoniphilus asaccharolyticus DSM 20463 TaxID=573058 RepID=A0A1W1V4C8_PEPAS|nr:large conductance mechanosensitive channel protein MscL [Peptoniphilus asaccharolyticus]MBL7576308.1 large conductance mechanosensitive channel protein MscL [Peptoniphilus asaccharolyticus]SMB88185.1 large conductance mechanosensitive channel [Peptoniphilus asaccharolyticus DSM 20463]
MSNFVKEFKEFIARGNVMDLAVAVIIGGAFGKIVTSVVDDVIMPVIAYITGGINFDNMFITLDGSKYATLVAAKEAGAPVMGIGAFVGNVINFLIIALVIFTMVKQINNIKKKFEKEEEEAAPTTKVCPHCKTEIAIDATRCPHCTSELN